MASKYHVRSISLPSTSHPSTVRVEEELNKLRTWEATSTSTSTSTSASICNALSALEELYRCLDDLLNMTSTQQVVSCNQQDKCVEELLDGSVRILDICGITRDTLLQIREHVQDLQSALRRRKGDSSIQSKVAEYRSFRKNMKKTSKKLIITLKQMENKFGVSPVLDQDHHLSAVIRVLREVTTMNISIFQSLLSFLAVPVSMPKAKKWSLITNLMHKGVIASEENPEDLSELHSVDAALCSLGKYATNEAAHERLEDLEVTIRSLENSLECVFRRLIKSRACLLNMISQ
ncbi:DUF241 domain protein [Quillaja saponaria]|uniref:DUF241 domain protein n=1 Tax=Quillaja saponaria TaxID=32244 RepID=A0AAD7P6N6_QUISA|nr:DUF241 domain protein [Quillaja saponaria]